MVEGLTRETLWGLPLGIGSLPYSDPKVAYAKVLRYFPQSPFCHELPRRDFREQMGNIQCEGIPGIVVDEQNSKIYLDTSKDLSYELSLFYEKYLKNDWKSFAMSPTYAFGLHTMLEMIKKDRPSEVRFLKGQLAGPTSFGLIITDENRKAVLYNEQFMDVMVKSSVLKARWMLHQFKNLGFDGIIFFDEPSLQFLGSATIPINRDQAVAYLNEVTDSVECPTGVHCCGNTDWSVLMETNVDIIAFDAFHFGDAISLYPQQLRDFLNRGGMLAWGIVPASEEASNLKVSDLMARLEEKMALLLQQGFSREEILKSALITPSCGLGSLSPELAEKILALTREVSDLIVGSGLEF